MLVQRVPSLGHAVQKNIKFEWQPNRWRTHRLSRFTVWNYALQMRNQSKFNPMQGIWLICPNPRGTAPGSRVSGINAIYTNIQYYS